MSRPDAGDRSPADEHAESFTADDHSAGEEAGGHEGVPVGGRDERGAEQATPAVSTGRSTIPLLEAVQAHDRTRSFIEAADTFLEAQGFTEHGFRHANLVGHIAFNVLTHLGYEQRLCELAAASGYLHDIGNVISRADHGQTGALLAFDALKDLDVPAPDMALILSAVGNHEEQYGVAVSPVAAAVILADKSDVHRSRVRKGAALDMDIHDRVNYAVESSFLRVDPEKRTLTLELDIDTSISHVLEYFEIFLERMVMCRRAGRVLGCDFKITVNDQDVL